MESICGGTLPYMDAYIGSLRHALGSSSQERVRFYYLEETLDHYDDIEGCDDERYAGCTRGTRVVSRSVPFEHELVHAVFADREPAHLLIEEGIAVLWGGVQSYRAPEGDVIEVAKRASRGTMEARDYSLAGHFMGHLMQDAGVDAIVEIGTKTAWPAWSYDHLQESFRQVLGQDFESTVAGYTASFPKCAFEDYREPIHACRRMDYEVCGSSSSVTITVDLECDSDRVIGVESGMMWTEVAVDLLRDGGYTLSLQEADDITKSYVTFRPCTGSCEMAASRRYEPSGELMAVFPEWYEAGRHVLRFVRPANSPGRMTVEIEGHNCE